MNLLKNTKKHIEKIWKSTFYYITLLFTCIAILLSGCGKNKTSDPTSATTKRDYDLFIYNADKNISSDFAKLCEAYTKKTGVVIKCVTPKTDEDSSELLEKYMNAENPPSIFSVTNLDELKHWQEEGKIFDFSNAEVEDFKSIVNKIPNALKLSSNDVDSFGIPYTIEGFGLIIDPKMFSSLFGGEYHKAILRDLENCSFDEFEGFVNAITLYITENSVYEFQLSGKSYSVLNKKSGLSENLNGVFAANYGNTDVISELFNVFLNRIFSSSATASHTSNDEITNSRQSLKNFLKMLDVLTTCVSGKTSTIYRGSELIDTKNNSKNQAIKNFVAGNSLFLIGKTSDFETISALDSDLANRLDFIPLKCSPKKSSSEDYQSNITTKETSAEKKINTSLSTIVPRYFSINSTIDKNELTQAQEFLTWIKTSDLANDYIVNKFGFVPYDTTDSGEINNSLSQSMLDYVKSTKILPHVIDGLDKTLRTETIPNYIIKNYLNNPLWGSLDYDEFAENILKLWLKN